MRDERWISYSGRWSGGSGGGGGFGARDCGGSALGGGGYSAILNIAKMVNVDSAVDGAVRRCLLVAEAEGRLLGFAVGKVIGSGTDGVGELESVAVDGSARRMGVGRALCRAVFAWCEGQNAEVVELEVRAGSGGR